MKYKIFLNKKVLCITNDYVLSYKSGCLFLSHLDSPNIYLQKKRISSGFSRVCLIERLMRLEPRCAVKLDFDHFLVSINGMVLNYCVSKNDFVKEHAFNRGMKNPLSFCSYELKTGEREILYGDYFWNMDKGPVAIYKRSSEIWKKVYEFHDNSVTHIHNIIFDSYRSQFIILTGDTDEESGIWFADTNFSKVQPIFCGSQKYRNSWADM